jgi:histone H3
MLLCAIIAHDVQQQTKRLRALSADAAGELNVLGHDGDTLGMDGAQVGVLEETNKVGLSSLLKGKDGRSLETKIGLEVLSDLTDETLEGKLADEKLGGLLVPADLAKSDGSWAVSVRLLDSASGRSTLASGLGGELLAGGLASGRFTSGLLGTSHFNRFIKF